MERKSLIKVLLLITVSVVLFLYNYRVCGFNFMCFLFHYNYIKAKISPGIHYGMFLSKKLRADAFLHGSLATLKNVSNKVLIWLIIQR